MTTKQTSTPLERLRVRCKPLRFPPPAGRRSTHLTDPTRAGGRFPSRVRPPIDRDSRDAVDALLLLASLGVPLFLLSLWLTN